MTPPAIIAMMRFATGPAIETRMSRAGSGLARLLFSIRVTPPMGSKIIERTAVALRHHSVRQLVQHHASEDDADQGESAARARGAHGQRFGKPHEAQQEQKR